jgi:hypothetical protein
VVSLLFALFCCVKGWLQNTAFTRLDDTLRHITATIAHIQLVVGYTLYFNSPFVTYFRQHYQQAVRHFEYLFFGIIHILLMTAAVVLITAGSSLAKRKRAGIDKFRTMAVWFAAALLVIAVAVPWPFSPLAQRPFIRTF